MAHTDIDDQLTQAESAGRDEPTAEAFGTGGSMLPVTGAAITTSGSPMAYLILGGCWIHPHESNTTGKWRAVTRDPQPLSRVFPEVTRRIPFDQRVQTNLMFHAKTITDRSQPDVGRSLGFSQPKTGSRIPLHIAYNMDQHISSLAVPDWWPSEPSDLPVLGATRLPNGLSVLYATPTKIKIYTSGQHGDNPKTICDTPPHTTALCHDPTTDTVYFFTSPTTLQAAKLTGTNHSTYSLSPVATQDIVKTWSDHPYQANKPFTTPQPAITAHSASIHRYTEPKHPAQKPYSVYLLRGMSLITGEVSQKVRNDFATDVPALSGDAWSDGDEIRELKYGSTGVAVPAAPVTNTIGGETMWPVGAYTLGVHVAAVGKVGGSTQLKARRRLIRGHTCETAGVYGTVLHQIDDKGSLTRSGRNEQNGGEADPTWKVDAPAAGPYTFASQSPDGRSIFASSGPVMRFNTVKRTSAVLHEMKSSIRQPTYCLHCAVSREGTIYALTQNGVDVLVRDEDWDYELIKKIPISGGIELGHIWWSATGSRLIALSKKKGDGSFSVFVIDPTENPATVTEIPVVSHAQGSTTRLRDGGLSGLDPRLRPEYSCVDPTGRYFYCPVDFRPSHLKVYTERFLLVVDLVAKQVVGRYRAAGWIEDFHFGESTFSWYWI